MTMGFWDRFHNSGVDHRELQERQRLAFVAGEQMRDWEGQDPENVGWSQCLAWGRRFLADRGVANPHVSESILEAGYIDILADKIRVALGPVEGEAALNRVRQEEAELRREMARQPQSPFDSLTGRAPDGGSLNVIERYVDEVTWRFETLRQVAVKTGALSGQVAQRLYAGRQRMPGR